MKMLVYGAGVLGSLHAARLHRAGHDVSLLARGRRLAALREHGVLLAEGDGPVSRIAVPVVEQPTGPYDLVAVVVRTHQVDAILPALAGLDSDVLFLLNHASGAEPLGRVLGAERVLLGFPTAGGVLDGDIVRYTAPRLMTRLLPMPIGEPDGRRTARLDRIVTAFRSAGFNAKAEPQMDAWLKTHAAFATPLARAAAQAGGAKALAADPDAIRGLIRTMRGHLDVIGTPVPRAFGVLRVIPEGLLVAAVRRFLRTPTADLGLDTTQPAAIAELDRLDEQLRVLAAGR
jgi:2-dehydropantoate 2-reductase